MIVLSFLLGIFASGALIGLICRLNMLHWRENSAGVIFMHIGLAFACVWALHDALHLSVTPGSFGAVLASTCWLVISFHTWSVKPPAHAKKA